MGTPALRLALCLAAVTAGTSRAEGPVLLRVESFPVAPAHTPSAVVLVKNTSGGPYDGVVRIGPPEGWRLEPDEHPVRLAPGQTGQVRFVVKEGTIAEENAYPLAVSATGGGATVTREQRVVTASAPYFKPDIDGNVDEWGDAIPVTWTAGGKKTVVRTYWNRRQLSILVEVEEEKLVRPGDGPAENGFDAVQLAISPRDAVTGSSPEAEASRYEFLMAAAEDVASGRVFQLAEPGVKLAETQRARELASLEYDDAEIAVRREGGVTYYECSLPFRPMSDHIRPSEGREFHLSVLVHDPDGTGVRDWGEAAGLWPCERNRLAWSDWPGAKWGDEPPFDNKTAWGLCSSKY
jgi:hypothetical protein